MILPAVALILWNDERGKITELRVVDIHDQGEWSGRLDNSAGACNHDWLDQDPLNTPMGLWLWLLTKWGFADEEVMIVALREFSHIDGQPWATQLLRRLGASENTDME